MRDAADALNGYVSNWPGTQKYTVDFFINGENYFHTFDLNSFSNNSIQTATLKDGSKFRYTKVDIGGGYVQTVINLQDIVDFSAKYVKSMGYELGTVGGTYVTEKIIAFPPMVERTKTTVVPTKQVRDVYDNRSAFFGQYNLNVGYSSSGGDFAAGILNGLIAQKWQNDQLEKQIANNPDFIRLFDYSMDSIDFSESTSMTSEHTSNILECTLNQVGTFYLGEYF